MIKVCLIGIGRTGIEIAKMLLSQEDLELVSVVCSPGSEKAGKDLGEILSYPATGITVESSEVLEKIIFNGKPDVVIDFSKPEATMKNARILSKLKVNMVIGTTGFAQEELEELQSLTSKYHSGILLAPNITLGVNVLMMMAHLAASILNDYDFQITEMHHKHKKDSPSGTAKLIAHEIEEGLADSNACDEHEDISINAIRAGGVIGRHEVMIIGEEDKIEIVHESFSRKAFAAGAVKGIRFICGKSGFYSVADMINIKKVMADFLDRDSRKGVEHVNIRSTKGVSQITGSSMKPLKIRHRLNRA